MPILVGEVHGPMINKIVLLFRFIGVRIVLQMCMYSKMGRTTQEDKFAPQ
jgi:hypothetical protein